MEFAPQAQWIWLPPEQDDATRNLTVRFRKTFNLEHLPEVAPLTLSADSRYILCLNGLRVGQGPARSWHHKKQFDVHDVAPFLKTGANVLAIQVVRWGVHCGFDQGGGPGGLLAHIDLGSAAHVTDQTWRASIHPSFARYVPRLAYGMSFSESFDARSDEDWLSEVFDDSAWALAFEKGPVTTAPWTEMQQRTIPMLLEQPVYPERLFDAAAVHPPRHALCLDLTPAASSAGFDVDSAYEASGLLVGELHAARDVCVTMIRMNTSFNLDAFDAMRLNGQDVAFNQDRAVLSLRKGANLLTVRFSPHYQAVPSWVFEGEEGLTFRAPFETTQSPIAVYMCRDLAGDTVAGALWDAASSADVRKHAASLRPFEPMDLLTDVFALTTTQEPVTMDAPAIQNPSACYSESAEYALVAVNEEADTELLLDFGEELVGFLAFEINASAGTILDFNCFEAILDGKRVWTDNLNNTLRYTAREGWQKYQAVVRMGFRYAQVTVRDAGRPVKIRYIRCLKNTYPVTYEGAFDCSDALLTRAWEMGRRTTQLCMEDTFVDCPAYEQTFWVGDCRNESLAARAAFGDVALAQRCMLLAADSLFRSPIPEQYGPSYDAHKNILPAWALLWLSACNECYQYCGDLAFARNIFPAVEKTCAGFLERRGEDGLMRFPGWNMLDWAPMDCPPGGAMCHENALLVRGLESAASLSDALGAGAAEAWRLKRTELIGALNAHLWDEEAKAYADSVHPDGERSKVFSQQSQTIALLSGCVPEDRLPIVQRYMEEVPEGWVTIGTPFMAWFNFEALAQIGKHREILDMMRRIWGTMARAGATTCWEHVAGSSGTSYRWTPTRSWCHAWSAAPTHFLSSHQLGVQGLNPGWTQVRVAPQPGGLTWAKGRVPTPLGALSVSWHINEERFAMEIIAPPTVAVEAVAPAGFSAEKVSVVHRSTSTVSLTPENVGGKQQ